MSLFGFLKKGSAGPTGSAPLVWFELQVTPTTFRFAFTPAQPVVISFAGEDSQKAVTTMINPDQAGGLYERTVRQVDALLKQNEILYLPLTQTEQAFADAAMKTPGVHVRFAFADDMSWASVYPREKLPPEIATLLSETRALARQILQQQSPGSSQADAARINSSSETAKIQVTRLGEIRVNEREIPLAGLNAFLDELKAKGGDVAYSRETSDEEPAEAMTKTVQHLVEAVMERELRIRLEVPPEELL
jgi:hypothetical protein